MKRRGGVIKFSFADIPSFDLILDGLFGTGFKGFVASPYDQIIRDANHSEAALLAIDIPSGLDGTTGEVQGTAIRATETVFLGLPKLGFFLREGWNHVGTLYPIDFGLPSSIVHETISDMDLIQPEYIKNQLPPIVRNRYKYQRGYVVGLAGSLTMPGAPLLACLAAYRGGCGMVRLLYPKEMESQLSNSTYELIKQPYHCNDPNEVITALEKGNALFIGPGLGRTNEVEQLLADVIPKLTKPTVLDADALYFLSQNQCQLPKQCILTPHLGEMQRLLGLTGPLVVDQTLIDLCRDYSDKHEVTLVLKGAPTFIFQPGTSIRVSPSGDPGMATAGSGDVLTGLIASLLAQGMGCSDAAAAGVYLHGVAGEIAALKYTSRSVIASDLIHNLPEAYFSLK